jgi:predicted DNA-binding transcriptional regulator YafY
MGAASRTTRTAPVRDPCQHAGVGVEATIERVLRLLALLPRRRSWTAAELAAELGVTDRSVRRDVERLRAVGYPVHATAGVGGGYQLGAGTRLPPLLLDDEEAIATAISLRMASGGTVAGVGEAALRALAKLDQVMPPRLRAEARAVHGATDTLVGPGVEIDPELLVTLARACRDAVRVRFRYAARDGDERERTVEPVRMVATSRRWYLMAHDVDRDDWRTFRLDRMREVVATTWRFRPREHPDPVGFVQRAVAEAPYRYLARVRLHAPPERVRELVPPQVGRVEDAGDGWCVLVAGGDDLDRLAMHVARLGFDARVLEPPELRAAAARLAHRVAALAEPPTTPSRTKLS